MMILKDISFRSPEENILFDDVLLDLAEHGQSGEALRFWESAQTFIVLGKISSVEENVRLDKVSENGIPVLRRSSGGGVVLQGKGCLNYSLILSKEINPSVRTLPKSYEFILGKIIESLKGLGVDAVFKPVSDIAVNVHSEEKKFSGNAQRRGRKFILHHGTILYDFPIGDIEKYLKIPTDAPAYRRGRSHSVFLTNVYALPQEIKRAVSQNFGVKNISGAVTRTEQERLSAYVQTKPVRIDLQEFFNCSAVFSRV